MSLRTPTENKNPMTHKRNDVMLSKSEASAFRAKRKQILRLRPQNDIQGAMQFIHSIFKRGTEDTKDPNVGARFKPALQLP
jgi:hypothetical protein